jgi:hypothetical protein
MRLGPREPTGKIGVIPRNSPNRVNVRRIQLGAVFEGELFFVRKIAYVDDLLPERSLLISVGHVSAMPRPHGTKQNSARFDERRGPTFSHQSRRPRPDFAKLPRRVIASIEVIDQNQQALRRLYLPTARARIARREGAIDRVRHHTSIAD